MSTILLVEDDVDLAEIWAELLEIQGHDVRVARTVSMARGLDVHDVDVAVIDWTLPDGSGAEVIANMRQRGFDAKLVITTGHGGDEVPEGTSGADVVMRKPFRVRELRQVIGDLTSSQAD